MANRTHLTGHPATTARPPESDHAAAAAHPQRTQKDDVRDSFSSGSLRSRASLLAKTRESRLSMATPAAAADGGVKDLMHLSPSGTAGRSTTLALTGDGADAASRTLAALEAHHGAATAEVAGAIAQATHQLVSADLRAASGDVQKTLVAINGMSNKQIAQVHTQLQAANTQLATISKQHETTITALNAAQANLIARLNDANDHLTQANVQLEQVKGQGEVTHTKLQAAAQQAASDHKKVVADLQKNEEQIKKAADEARQQSEKIVSTLHAELTKNRAEMEKLNKQVQALEQTQGRLSHETKNSIILGLSATIALQATVASTLPAVAAGAAIGATYRGVVAAQSWFGSFTGRAATARLKSE